MVGVHTLAEALAPLCTCPVLVRPPPHAFVRLRHPLKPAVSLPTALSLVRAPWRKVHVLVVCVHLGPRSRPGRGDVVSKCRQS